MYRETLSIDDIEDGEDWQPGAGLLLDFAHPYQAGEEGGEQALVDSLSERVASVSKLDGVSDGSRRVDALQR